MKNEITNTMKKSELTKEELKKILAKTEDSDPKLDHYRAYRTLMNETRRELLKFIGYEIRSIDEIKKEFNLEDDQLNFHLSMLSQSLFIIESHKGWKSTPRGIGFLNNAKMGE
ncbi:MAG: hypothetical protein ACFE9Z_12295 [Promethearchaeota archaeon]